MTFSNKNSANKLDVVEALETLRTELKNGPLSSETAAALEQCERLSLAIEQFHAEGIRFAAFTLLRMVQHNRTSFTPTVQNATVRLREKLDAAGLPH